MLSMAILNETFNDDGSGLESRGSVPPHLERTLNDQNRKRMRHREGSASSSGDGQEEDGFHVRENYTHRMVKPGTIKACNECRQQKLKCDVIKEPFQACSRCRRLKIDCKVDATFKRVGKRNKHAEMQREIENLKRQLAEQQAAGAAYNAGMLRVSSDGYPSPASTAALTMQRLEDVALSGERLGHLYNQFFTFYHPFLPLLDPVMTSDQYFALCPLLGWTIVLIAARRSPHEPTLLASLSAPYTKLLWATVGEMPQSYHAVKALALYCTWPLPCNSSAVDLTFMISGLMMQIALQTGLHRPLHAQDFGKYVKDVRDSEVKDRTITWAVCNIICQNASNGYGQPSTTIYDWTLGLGLTPGRLSSDLETHLKIAKFCQKVTKNLYSNSSDAIGLIPENEQRTIMSILRTEYQELETSIASSISPTNKLYLLAASLHLHCFAFFIPKSTPTRHSELSHLYHAATSYIQACLDHDLHSTSLLYHCPNWLQQCMVSASCTLLKLLNSSFAKHLDIVQGKSLFNSAVLALRTISIKNNDIPARLAEALGRMWRAAGSGLSIGTIGIANEQDDPLQLRVRCRMSFSHVFDCIWGWRGTLQLSEQTPLKESTSTTAVIPFSPQAGQALPPNQGLAMEDSGLMSNLQDFDLFNSLDWMLDDTGSFAW